MSGVSEKRDHLCWQGRAKVGYDLRSPYKLQARARVYNPTSPRLLVWPLHKPLGRACQFLVVGRRRRWSTTSGTKGQGIQPTPLGMERVAAGSG